MKNRITNNLNLIGSIIIVSLVVFLFGLNALGMLNKSAVNEDRSKTAIVSIEGRRGVIEDAPNALNTAESIEFENKSNIDIKLRVRVSPNYLFDSFQSSEDDYFIIEVDDNWELVTGSDGHDYYYYKETIRPNQTIIGGLSVYYDNNSVEMNIVAQASQHSNGHYVEIWN